MPNCYRPLCLVLLSPLCAQEWVITDSAPAELTHAVFDRAQLRLLGLGGFPPQTWSTHGQAWHLHQPDGLDATNAEPVVVRALGYDEGRSEAVLVVERYVGTTQTLANYVMRGAGWRLAGTGTTVPAAAATAFDFNRNQLIAFGGGDNTAPTDSMCAWNGTSWVPLAAPVRPSPRTGAAMATDRARNRVVLFGGRGSNGLFGDTWEWDGSTWQQRSVTAPPSPRQTTMAFDASTQRVVMTGNLDAWAPDIDCWSWDGVQWTPRASLPSPGAHRAFDAGGTLLVTIGNEVWRSTGTGWTQVFAVDELSNRDYPAIAYDPTRRETLAVTTAPRGGTWRWNGNWQFVTATGPGDRRRAAIAPLGNNMVLFGGSGTTSMQLFDDTWLWNGQSWTSLSFASRPPARHGHTMVTTNNKILLFGGEDLLSTFGDTWCFDGVVWSQLAPTAFPGNRSQPSMAFDPLRQRVVLYGGQGSQQFAAFDDTWEWDGTTWAQVESTLLQPTTPWLPLPLVFDSSRAQVVLANQSHLYGWNGSAWSNPQHLTGAAIGVGVFDVVRQSLVTWSVSTRVLTSNPATASIAAQACGNQPDLRLFGRAALGTTSSVHIEGLPGAPAFIVFGLQPQLQNLAPGCDRMVSIDAVHFVLLDGAGRFDKALAVPLHRAFVGMNLQAQVAVVDGGPVSGVSVSGALRLVLGD